MKKLVTLLILFLTVTSLAGTFIKGPALVEGHTEVTAAAGTTTLTKDSETFQVLNGATTQTYVLPAANTLPLGRLFKIANNSTGTATVNRNGGALVAYVYPGQAREFKVTDISTAAGSWVATEGLAYDILSTNTVNSIVKRGASGEFAAGYGTFNNSASPGTTGTTTTIDTVNPNTVGLTIKGSYDSGSLAAGTGLYIPYSSNLDATYSLGSSTGTSGGSAAVSGGFLVIDGASKSVYYDCASNCDTAQTGTIRFTIKPDYSGNPSSYAVMFSVVESVGSLTNNAIYLQHNNTNGNLEVVSYSSAGAPLNTSAASFGAWSPTAGTEYVFEFNFDYTTGEQRLFIDGIQQGPTRTVTGSRSTSIGRLYVGNYPPGGYHARASFKDFSYFTTVQHTADHAFEVPYVYGEQNVDLLRFTDSASNILSRVSNTGRIYGSSGEFTSMLVGDNPTEGDRILLDNTYQTTVLGITSLDGVDPLQAVIHKHSTTYPAGLLGARANSDTVAHSSVTAGMSLFEISSAGWLTSTYQKFGTIDFGASTTGSLSSTSSPGYIDLKVTPDGAVTPASALHIDQNKTATFSGDINTNLTTAGPVSTTGSGLLYSSLPADFTVTLSNFVGDSGSGGTKGLVPAPAAGDAAANKYLMADGSWAVPSGTGIGTVTSVGLSMPAEFTVSGSPVTSAGTLAVTEANQNANTVYAGPTSGAAAAPGFRALGLTDLPNGGNDSALALTNCSIAASISSNQLVVALKGADGNDTSATNPCKVGFRNSTETTGSYSIVSFEAANSITLGTTDSIGQPASSSVPLWVYLVDDGTDEICLSKSLLNENKLQSATALTGGAEVTGTTLYCTSAHTSKPIRTIGQVTATWSNPNWGSIVTAAVMGNINGFSGSVIAPDYNGTTSINTVRTVAADYTVTVNDETILVDTNAAIRTITFPAASGFKGKKFIIQPTDTTSYYVQLSYTGGGYGVPSKLFSYNQQATIYSDGTTWRSADNFYPTSAEIRFSAGTPSVWEQNPAWITSLTDGGTGIVTINTNVFSGDGPWCTCSTKEQAVSGSACMVTSATDSAIIVHLRDLAGTLADEHFFINCRGQF